MYVNKVGPIFRQTTTSKIERRRTSTEQPLPVWTALLIIMGTI